MTTLRLPTRSAPSMIKSFVLPKNNKRIYHSPQLAYFSGAKKDNSLAGQLSLCASIGINHIWADNKYKTILSILWSTQWLLSPSSNSAMWINLFNSWQYQIVAYSLKHLSCSNNGSSRSFWCSRRQLLWKTSATMKICNMHQNSLWLAIYCISVVSDHLWILLKES